MTTERHGRLAGQRHARSHRRGAGRLPALPATVLLLDERGEQLAVVKLELGARPDGPLKVERVVTGAGRLLKHHFGRGENHVVVAAGDLRYRARLSTRWTQQHREWRLELSSPSS